MTLRLLCRLVLRTIAENCIFPVKNSKKMAPGIGAISALINRTDVSQADLGKIARYRMCGSRRNIAVADQPAGLQAGGTGRVEFFLNIR